MEHPAAGMPVGREASLAILPPLHEPVEVQAVEEELPEPIGTDIRLSAPADSRSRSVQGDAPR